MNKLRPLALGALLPLFALAATPPPAAQAEIMHLLGYLEHSGCEFSRNGSWHTPAEGRAHLERKYQYLLDKGLVTSTEDFIDRAASRSSISGKAYQVRCPHAAPVASADWLNAELRRQRSATAKLQP